MFVIGALARCRSPTTSRLKRRCGELRRAYRADRRTSGATPTFFPSPGGPPGPSGRLASRAGLGRLHAADPRGSPRPAAGATRGVGQERRRQPDAFLQGPGRLGGRRAGPRARFEVIACASTGNLANSVAAHGAALGMGSSIVPPISRSRRCSRPESSGRNS